MQSRLFLMQSLGIYLILALPKRNKKKPHTKLIQKLQRQNEQAGGQIHLQYWLYYRWGVEKVRPIFRPLVCISEADSSETATAKCNSRWSTQNLWLYLMKATKHWKYVRVKPLDFCLQSMLRDFNVNSNQIVNRVITRKRQRTDTIHVEISTIEHAEYQCQPAYVCLLFNFFLKFNMKYM